MKLRTLEELEEALNGDLIWRKRELHQPVKLLRNSLPKELETYLCRSAIAMYYAHWEGFIKRSIECYRYYIQTRRPMQVDLVDEIRIYASRRLIQDMKATPSLRNSDIDAISSLITPQDSRFEHGAIEIDTKSNLNREQTVFLLRSVGVRVHDFVFSTKDFDKTIVERRNSIAHGEYVSISSSDVVEIRDRMLSDLMSIRDEILEMAVDKRYLKATARNTLAR